MKGSAVMEDAAGGHRGGGMYHCDFERRGCSTAQVEWTESRASVTVCFPACEAVGLL